MFWVLSCGGKVMGLVYLNNEEERIYEAYGMTVYGKQDRYTWSIYPDKPDENVYTSLRIERNEDEVCNINLGNRCIFKENFNRTVDNFYGGLIKTTQTYMTSIMQSIKKLCESDSLFNHLLKIAREKNRLKSMKGQELKMMKKRNRDRSIRSNSIVRRKICYSSSIMKKFI